MSMVEGVVTVRRIRTKMMNLNMKSHKMMKMPSMKQSGSMRTTQGVIGNRVLMLRLIYL